MLSADYDTQQICLLHMETNITQFIHFVVEFFCVVVMEMFFLSFLPFNLTDYLFSSNNKTICPAVMALL